ncbi:hypothetical protein J8273_0374 [Carpediemonas membranifera]|uniref:Uncharacterized protein n=1 Tax=Carpediemonas membranifera TaxID=201153 RepID=A0A8J6EAR3_9EUKA|nr:hypothetical protein J8273_0374 [Carpediemonas membranifera]|eukprot:KAG9395155.1 hypothetical protein J8273_0374 [Carpediemonas membranifera]
MSLRQRAPRVSLEPEESDPEFLNEEEQQQIVSKFEHSTERSDFFFKLAFASIFAVLSIIFIVGLVFTAYDPTHPLSHDLLFNRVPRPLILIADAASASGLVISALFITTQPGRRTQFHNTIAPALVMGVQGSALWTLTIVGNLGKHNVPFFMYSFPLVAVAPTAAWYIDHQMREAAEKIAQLRGKMYGLKTA